MIYQGFMLYLVEQDHDSQYPPNRNTDQYRISSLPYCNRKAYFVKAGNKNQASDYLARLGTEGRLHHEKAQKDAVDYALEKGCIVVAAGGNDGVEQENYPAAYPGVIGVSALGYNDEIWSSSNSGRHIDVCAPGVNIISTGSNWNSDCTP